jgi:hypothetical protein
MGPNKKQYPALYALKYAWGLVTIARHRAGPFQRSGRAQSYVGKKYSIAAAFRCSPKDTIFIALLRRVEAPNEEAKPSGSLALAQAGSPARLWCELMNRRKSQPLSRLSCAAAHGSTFKRPPKIPPDFVRLSVSICVGLRN